MPNPRDALIQHELLKDNLTKLRYTQFLQYFSEDVFRKKASPLITGGDGKPSGRAMAENQIAVLGRAPTYYVSAEMSDVAIIAGLGLDGIDQFSHDLWPTDDGFLLFQKGLLSLDVWGKPVVAKAFVWQRKSYNGAPGTLLFTYSHMDDERDSFKDDLPEIDRDEIAAKMGRMMLLETAWIADGQRVGPATHKKPEDYQRFEDPEKGYVLSTEESTNNSRPVLALLMLLNQTIVDLAKHDLRPPSPKRQRKMRVPAQVTVITLRHTKGAVKEPGESHIEWQHRWIVRGFWRSQAVGPNYPLAQEVSPGKWRARLYIAPYPKGPSDKPWLITQKVYSLTR